MCLLHDAMQTVGNSMNQALFTENSGVIVLQVRLAKCVVVQLLSTVSTQNAE